MKKMFVGSKMIVLFIAVLELWKLVSASYQICEPL